ncbi:hypothetical protein [Bernardetia litoralis]|nr:hypothetical protein [Bernardetia litoralis]
MKRFIELFIRFIFYRTYRNIEKMITSMIDKSEGILENIKVDETVKFDKKWESHLFNIYDNPQKCSVSIKEKLDKYTLGQNWELAWVKATFELIGLSQIENHVDKLKSIIEECHIWYSIAAMKVLVKHPDFFDKVENIEFIEKAFEKKGKFGSYGHIYMKYLSALRDKPLVISLLSRLITRSLVKDTDWDYLRSWDYIKDLYKQENPLVEKYCYYFLDVAISEQRIKIF